MLLPDPPGYCSVCGVQLVKPPAPELWPGSAPRDVGTEERWGGHVKRLTDKPQYWHSQDGESTEIEVSEMIGALVRATQPEFVVETGSAWGQTTRYIGEALKRNGHGLLVSLEPDYARRVYAEWYCHELMHGWVTFSSESSLEYSPGTTIDFLFSDSLHNIRQAEILRFLPHMEAHSLVVVHDTVDTKLQGELDDLMEFRNVRLHTPRGVTIMEVIG